MTKATQERALEQQRHSTAGPRTGLELALGSLGSDQLQPANRVGLAERQRHHHPPVLVATGLCRLPLAERDGHHCAQRQLLNVLTTATQQLAQAASDGRQHHVVDLGVVGVGDSLGNLHPAADDCQLALGADRAVEAGAWRALFGKELPPRRPGIPRPP